MRNFISNNKKPLAIAAIVVIGFIGYKYASAKIKGKRDQDRNVSTDINAVNHGDYKPSTEIPTGAADSHWGRSLFDVVTLGVFKNK